MVKKLNSKVVIVIHTTFNPVIPAPSPVAKQFNANAIPNKSDSFRDKSSE